MSKPHPLLIQPDECNTSSLLSLWAYLLPDLGEVLGLSPFGDWFLLGTKGSVDRIDLLEGRVDQVAGSVSEFRDLLSTVVGADSLLYAGLVDSLCRNGVLRRSGQCYTYRLHPRLGGQIHHSNILIGDLAVWQMICAQLHPQIDSAPASAVFAGLQVDDGGGIIVRWQTGD